jgi:hypothetical protein
LIDSQELGCFSTLTAALRNTGRGCHAGPSDRDYKALAARHRYHQASPAASISCSNIYEQSRE